MLATQGPARLSDFGSRMGAGRLGQAASDAVIVTVRRSLTCADAVTWPVWPAEHCIRIEGVRGSNPLSSTSKADFEHGIGLFGLRTATLAIELPAQPLERVPEVFARGLQPEMTASIAA
jgi:hypothetical protein